jgi:flagellar hook assembly protein FlgD
VELAIYSVDGRRVRTLARGAMDVGEYRMTWDGRDDNGVPVSAGMFFARLSAPQGQFTKSLVYLR